MNKRGKEFFCNDLPTDPKPVQGKILVTGASGYIGGRLAPELLARGYRVKAMMRVPMNEFAQKWPSVELVVADALEPDLTRLKKALDDVDTAYYLLHSLHLGPREFEAADLKAAHHFRLAAEARGVKRIIYLGGLGDIRSPLSSHLRNRIAVARELKKGAVPVTILRAAIIIGSGSASYEIIRHLVKNIPIILIPFWATNRCQPIAVRDVIKYLVGVLELPQTIGQEFDIGGGDVLSYKQMLQIQAKIYRRQRIFIPFSFFNIKFCAYFASLFTPVPNLITQCLMEGLKNDVVCQNDLIRQLIPFQPLSYREAIVRAMTREDQDRVSTRWSDAYPPAHELAIKLRELKKKPAFISIYSLKTNKKASSLFKTICKIGGREGWFNHNWLWRLRGIIDRILLGVGTSRGRKSTSNLKTNDVVDFWRVEDIKENKRLLLRAEMKLPGRAWLEFNIRKSGPFKKLSVIALFDTGSWLGRLYWYCCLPFHHLIFRRLIQDIDWRSR